MFEGQRISRNNLNSYTNNEQFIISKYIPFVPVLLQKDYGEDCDCTLTSITAVIKFLKPQYEIQEIYNWVERIAKAYGYKGTSGTNYLVIKTVYKKSLQGFGITNNPKSYYLKNLCFDYEDIKYQIDKNQPVLLNLWKDGRNLYKNHTVLITGYCYTKNYKMLIIHDNWYNTVSYIDYNKLNSICSIQIL